MKRATRRAVLVTGMALTPSLVGCGGGAATTDTDSAGSAEESVQAKTEIIGVERVDDSITVDIVFDQAYENATVQFHADADNDSFKGTADLVEELGAVEVGNPYTVTVSTETSSWAVSGQFLHVNSASLVLDPQLTQETIHITVLDGETELASTQSDPEE